MANEKCLALIRQGVDDRNDWRVKNAEVRPDLSEANLYAMDLRGVDFRDTNLFWAYLVATDLRGVNLTTATSLTWKQVESAITDSTTLFPDYLT